MTEDFSSASTWRILADAGRRAHFDGAGATLLRLGENALYRLVSEPVVVRIARTMDYWEQVQNEVAVARWLADMAYPAARLDERTQPLDVSGHPVTFWQFIGGRDAGPGDVSHLARLLRGFHQLQKPVKFDLHPYTFGTRIARRLETAPISDSDKVYLRDKFRDLTEAVEYLTFPLPVSAVHGDAHIKNVMISQDGDEPLLIDFENTGWGHPEWDLAVTATEYVSGRLWTDDQYGAFVDAYGYDITTWSGFEVLKQIQEIKMTTWLSQNINESRAVAEEFSLRMRTIRTGLASAPWQGY
ncbi:phosphotransferase family protein [Actinoalloteichus caeruleus]|uniref:phosphotransferase family protein n=1 Tax=Actinoalloteichus cyanogriseus TaxID=2893586 RepID=UPI003BB8C873